MTAAPSSSPSSTDPFASLSSTPPFRLDLFAVLDKVQASHGIPHQDYAQYHTYCTHRLSRLRHLRAVQTDLVHSHHSAAQAQSLAANAAATTTTAATSSSSRRGPRHAYCPRPVVPPHRGLHHEALLWNIVFQAERAWAQACAAQQQQNSSSGTNQRSRHSFVLKRLHKAQKWATILVQVLEEQPQHQQHAETLQECRSYAAWMTANAALEQEDYTTAFHRYKESMEIVSTLVATAAAAAAAGSVAASESVSETTLAVWKTRSETILRPLVRFCAYHAKEDASLSLVTEDAIPVGRSTPSASGTSPKKDSTSSIVLRFRGKQVRLDSYKQLAVLYLKMEGLLKTNRPSELNESQFLQLSTDLDDALRLVQAELTPAPSTKSNNSTTTNNNMVNQNKRRDLPTLAAYLESQKLRLWRIQQERHVLPELTSDAEIVHVYDQLLQNAMALANLTQPHDPTHEAGGGRDGEALGNTNADNEDDPYWLTAQAHVVRIRAVRCFYLARLYETELQASPATVLALLRHAAKLNKRAQEEIAACIEDDDTDDEKEHPIERRDDYEFYLKNLETVADQIPTMMARVQAARFVQQHQGSSRMAAVKTNRPLWLRLDEMDAGGGTVLVDRPPQPIAIPCKPVFYDVAWQHVVGDATALEKIQAYIEAHEPKSKTNRAVGGGLLSWFTR